MSDPALRASFERNLARYFERGFPGGAEVELGFLHRRSFRTIGKADVRKRRILIHRDLVAIEWRLVLDLVMYHEMIHFLVLKHNRRFRLHERLFENYVEARRQEREFFHRLEHKHAAEAELYTYQCPRCRTPFYYRTRRGHLFACGRCARRFDPRYRLVPVSPMRSRTCPGTQRSTWSPSAS